MNQDIWERRVSILKLFLGEFKSLQFTWLTTYMPALWRWHKIKKTVCLEPAEKNETLAISKRLLKDVKEKNMKIDGLRDVSGRKT